MTDLERIAYERVLLVAEKALEAAALALRRPELAEDAGRTVDAALTVIRVAVR